MSDRGDRDTVESETGDTGTGDSGTGDSGTGDSGTGDSGTGDSGTGDRDGQYREPKLVVVQAVPANGEERGRQQGEEGNEQGETVERPAKVMRIGSMIRQLLEEARQAPLDEAGRARLAEIYDTSRRELQDGLSPELVEELVRIAPPFNPGSVPSESELRVAQAQLVGWLEGLFAGIQATVFAQQMAQRAQLEEARRRGLPSAREDRDERPMPGTYL